MIVDHLTSFPIAIPIPNKEAGSVVEAFHKHFILQYRCPNPYT